MSKNNKQNGTLGQELVEARREGRYNRASTWSANGERKNHRRKRKNFKKKIRKEYGV